MNYENISTLSMAGMVVSLVIAFVIPIGSLLYLIIKRNAKVSTFFIGCGTFIVFAFFLETIFHSLIFSVTGNTIKDNIFLYTIYGGVAAALFEETGRFLAMKFLMKKRLTSDNALMFGVGHGGIEAMLILGISEVTNLALSSLINAGKISTILDPITDPALKTETYNSISALWTTSSDLFFLAGVERIFSITGHVAMSYLVFMAIKYGQKKCLALAYVFHFILDASSGLVSSYTSNVYVTELCILIVVAFIVYTAVYFKNQLGVDTDE